MRRAACHQGFGGSAKPAGAQPLTGAVAGAGAAVAAAALGFCVWTAVCSDLKLLLVSLGFLVLTVPLWLGVRASSRGRAAAASGLPG